jgi:hypothetical protein
MQEAPSESRKQIAGASSSGKPGLASAGWSFFLWPASTARGHSGSCSGWEVDEEVGSAAWRAEQLHGSGEGVDAVGVTGQPGAVLIGAPDAVVSRSQGEELPALFY